MKKSFFKKLSFVMAAAMTMSFVTPAAGAFAATAPKLNSAKKYLYLDVEDKNDYNFNITTTKGSGWNYLWESSDEDVAVVDESNGVTTATGVGTAKITVFITDKDGEEVGDASATVIVKDNIKEVTIANKPEKDTLAVGQPFDFNRNMVTVSGSTTVTSSVTRWTVTPAEGAAITDAGVFTADKAGKYTVKAFAFQSKEKYTTWKADPVANAALVLDSTDGYEVTVAPTMKSAQQLTSTTAKLTFDADMSKELTVSNLKAYRVIAGVSTPVDLLVKKVSFDATGKEATVEMFVDFIGGENYKFVYGTMEAGFAASKADADQVASIVFETKEAVYTDPAAVPKVKLFNANGVDITTAALLARVDFTITNNVGYMGSDDKLVLFAKGDVAAVKATFHTYKYDANYQEIVVEATGSIVAVDATSYGLGNTVAWTLATSAPDWSKAAVTKVAAGDFNYSVWARVQSTKTAATEYYYSYAGTNDKEASDSDANASKFSFASSNDDVLTVYSNGSLYPAKAGTAVIICYYGTGSDKKAIATFAVEVLPTRAPATFSLDKNVVTVSNTMGFSDTQTVKLSIKDQLGADFFDNIGVIDLTKIKITPLASNPETGSGPALFAGDKESIIVSGQHMAKGTWTYKVEAYDKVQILTVEVQEPTLSTPNDGNFVNDVVYYRMTLDKSTVDRAVAKDAAIESVTPTLTGFASNGVAVYKATWSDGFTYTLEKSGDSSYVAPAGLLDGTVEVAVAGSPVTVPSVSGTTITIASDAQVNALATGAYVIKASLAGEVKGTQSFTVVDTKGAANFILEKTESTEDTVLLAVRDAFKVQLAGSDIADLQLYNVKYVLNGAEVTDTTNDDVAVAGNLFIKSVDFVTTFTDANAGNATFAVKYTVDINRNIVIK